MSVLNTDMQLSKPGFSLDIQCEIQEPVVGIFGPSGAGKTTFLRLIAGLETADTGHIDIQNTAVFDHTKKINLKPEKRKIGYVFQEGRLFPHLNVMQNLNYGLKNNSNLALFEEITSMLQITELFEKRIAQISGGQAQRVAIGRALLSSPALLILDEPFSALDKNLRQHIIALLKPLIQNLKIPMLVVSHDLPDLLTLSEQLLIIQHGRVAGHGNYYDLIQNNEIVTEMSKSGLINSLELKLDFIDGEKGMMILSHGKQLIFAESWLDGNRFLNDPQVNIILRPEDITLALHQIKDISMQNQIEGKIEKLITTENKVLCVVDHGFKLIAEVTLATKQKMNLKEGDVIWSLFKAAAVKMNTKGIVKSGEI